MGALVAIATAACSSGASTSPVPGAGWLNGVPHAAPGAPRPTSPNIVFVLTDDLTWNLVRYMPHVLAMERAGVTFPSYFVTDSLCCPSRTSIFTGEFPHDDGVYNNSGPDGGFSAFLAHGNENRSFASVLQGRGYLTAMLGKYINTYEPQLTYFGQRPYATPGWSAWDVADHFGYNELGYTLGVGHSLGRYGTAPSDYLTSVLSGKASQFIAESAQAHKPFMAEIATYSPHAPFVPAPADAASFPGLTAPHGPAYGRAVQNPPDWLGAIPPLTPTDTSSFNRVFRLRVQDVQSVDRMIGRLENEVRSLGVADNTYFVFSSDNGLHLGEHNLRQGKGTAFDTDVRVPLVVTGPGVPAGGTISQLAGNIDLAPTFETLAGATPPANVDGHSLVAQLHGVLPSGWRDAVLFEHHRMAMAPNDPDHGTTYSGNPPSYEAIRTSRYLYVEYADGERELYDLTRDPAELDNVYTAISQTQRDALHAAVQRMATCHGTVACWRAQRLAP